MTLDSPATTRARDIESAWQIWREHLLAQFETLSDEEQQIQLYLLVDSRAKPGLDKLLPMVPGLTWVSLWRDSVLESYADIAPYLVHIDRFAFSDPRDLHNRLVRRFWNEGFGLHMVTWIWSPHGLDVLAQHFQRYSGYTTPDRRKFVLHFYDNRVLERLRAVWTEEQTRGFLSPCTEIWYRDREWNDVVWRDAATRDSSIPDGEAVTGEQHARLLWLGRADKLAMQVRDMYGAILDKMPGRELYQRVSEQLERAAQYRIVGDDDLLNYVSKGILISAAFDEHPVIQERLRSALKGELTYREALTGIDRDALAQAAVMGESSEARER